MDLSNPSTQANLEAAFGGESMANRKYLFFADVAKQLGHAELAKLFRDTANQETEHAFAHFRLLHPELGVADPAGLKVDNVATASDLARMVAAAETYPFIRRATTTTQLSVRPYAKRGPLNFANTNRLLKNHSWQIGLSKTGYINEAGRCLVMRARIDGEPVSIVLLNSFGKLTPFGDSNRVKNWLLNKG